MFAHPSGPGPGSAPSAGHAVVGVKLRLDVADTSQQLAQDCLPVTAVTVLDATHSLHGVTVHLHSAVTMGTKSGGLFGLELLLPLQAVLLDLGLGLLLRLLQTAVLTCTTSQPDEAPPPLAACAFTLC